MPEATKVTQEEVSTGSQDEEVLAAHEDMHETTVEAMTANVVPEKLRDPSRYYIWHIGGVREGYWDEFLKEEKTALEENQPDIYEGIVAAEKDFKKAQAKKGKKAAGASETPEETNRNGNGDVEETTS